jgi:hypothetical protein
MPFLPDARTAAADSATPREVRLTLDYLIQNAIGRNNARPLADVLRHLASHGIHMSGPQFQTTILADTRVGDIFIGSGSHGYFLIDNSADAQAALQFYESRIRSELARINHLKQLAASRGWTI